MKHFFEFTQPSQRCFEKLRKRRAAKIPSLTLMVRVLGGWASTPALSQTQPNHPALPFQAINEVPLSGQATRWDYAGSDNKHHHLFLAHLGDDAVVVFDTPLLHTLRGAG